MFKALKFNKILDLLIEIDYLAIVFFVPITFAIFLPNANIFELNKIILFRCLLGFLMVLSFVRFFLLKKTGNKIINFNFFKHYLAAPVAFLALIGFTLFFSIDGATSFWGLYDRQEGYLNYLFYFLFFILIFWNLLNSFRENAVDFQKKIFRIICSLCFAGVVSSVYGILQIMGIDFLYWTEPASLTGRATSTLGQPNFLGSFLLLVLPLSFYLAMTAKNKYWRWPCLLFSFFNLVCLLFTSSRGAWVALIVGLGVLAFIYFLKNRRIIFEKINYRWFIAGLIAVVLFFGLLFSFDKFFRERTLGMFDFKNGSVAARVYFWRASFDAISKQPLFGYGLENQEEILTKYYEPDWGIFANVNSRTNRAHNFILDILLTSGLVGLTAWTILLIFAFKMFWRAWRYSNNKKLALALYFSLMTYVLSLFFGFSFVAGNVYFWFGLALLAALDFSSRLENYFQNSLLPVNRIFLGLLFLPILFFSGKMFLSDYENLIQDHYFKNMQTALLGERYFEAYTLYKYIKEEQTGYFYYDASFIKILYNKFFTINDLSVLSVGKKITSEILHNINGSNYSQLQTRALAEAIVGNYSAAKNDFTSLIAYSPSLPENYIFKAKMLAASGDYVEALATYDVVLNLIPAENDSRLNWEHLLYIKKYKAMIYVARGDIYMAHNDYVAARQNYKMALGDDFELQFYKKIADTYYLENNLDKAIWYNERAALISPDDYIWPYSLAILYKEKGDKVKALEYATRALQLNTTVEGINELINSLK